MVKVLYSEAQIAQQVRLLAERVDEYYAPRVSVSQPLVVLLVLKGALMFGADLSRQLRVPLYIEFLRASSYREGTVSGALHLDIPQIDQFVGRHLLVVEDIIDTGKTVSRILDALGQCSPASIEVCTLLDKPARRTVAVKPTFCGFTVEDRFVIGYGMDFAERYRELPYVGELECTS